MSILAVSRIKVAVDGSDADGLLVLQDGTLVAVLVYLDEPYYGKDKGRWHLETGFGRCSGTPATFENIGAALHWIAARLGLDGDGIMPAITNFRTVHKPSFGQPLDRTPKGSLTHVDRCCRLRRSVGSEGATRV